MKVISCEDCGVYYILEFQKRQGKKSRCDACRLVIRKTYDNNNENTRNRKNWKTQDGKIYGRNHDHEKEPRILECKRCGKTFKPKLEWNGYRHIFAKGQNKREICYECVPLNSGKKFVKKPKQKKACLMCGKEFMGHGMHKYCGKECAHKAQIINSENANERRLNKELDENIGVCDKKCHDMIERVKRMPDPPKREGEISQDEEKKIIEKAKDSFSMDNFITVQSSEVEVTGEIIFDTVPAVTLLKRIPRTKEFRSRHISKKQRLVNQGYIGNDWVAYFYYRLDQSSHVLKWLYIQEKEKYYEKNRNENKKNFYACKYSEKDIRRYAFVKVFGKLFYGTTWNLIWDNPKNYGWVNW